MHIVPKSIFGKSILDIYFCPKQKSKKDFGEKHVRFDAQDDNALVDFFHLKKGETEPKKVLE